MKYEDENSYGRLQTKPDESLETKSREDAEGRLASIAPRSLWGEGNEAKWPDEAQLWIRRPELETKSGLVLST